MNNENVHRSFQKSDQYSYLVTQIFTRECSINIISVANMTMLHKSSKREIDPWLARWKYNNDKNNFEHILWLRLFSLRTDNRRDLTFSLSHWAKCSLLTIPSKQTYITKIHILIVVLKIQISTTQAEHHEYVTHKILKIKTILVWSMMLHRKCFNLLVSNATTLCVLPKTYRQQTFSKSHLTTTPRVLD